MVDRYPQSSVQTPNALVVDVAGSNGTRSRVSDKMFATLMGWLGCKISRSEVVFQNIKHCLK